MKKLALSLLIAGSAALALAACERPLPGVLQNSGDAPLVVDLDTTSPIALGAEETFDVRGPTKGHGEVGGATGTFIASTSTSGMCVILDPENQWLDSNYSDDGDIELFVGRTADYTGVPGQKIGDFHGEWVDPLGISHELDQNLCIQRDLFGDPGAHAGLGTAEFCTVDTTPGVSYTVLGTTFSVPSNDDVLRSSVEVLDGPCPAIDECTLVADNSGGVCGQP